MTRIFRSALFKITSNVKIHQRQSHKRTKSKDPCTGRPQPLLDLNCKVALITGGNDGMGLAIAHELLTEKAKKVALCGTDVTKGRDAVNLLNRAYGSNKAAFLVCDVQIKSQVCECFNKVCDEFGPVDIVVNAAGVFDGCNYEKEIKTNLVGKVHSTIEGYKRMNQEEEGQGGVILNIAGLHGLKRLYPAPTLSAGFHGVVGLSRSFGHQRNFSRSGVRVVTLCPGITNTNFVKDAEQKSLNAAMGKQLQLLLCKIKRQKADVCGLAAVHVLKYGETGSVWVVDGSKLYSVNIPEWTKYRTLQSQFI